MIKSTPVPFPYHMRFQTTFTAEPAGTFRAGKWFRSSMTDQMLT